MARVVTFAPERSEGTLLIIEMLMNCIFNQINGAFHNYFALYIGVIIIITNIYIQGQIIMKGTVNLVKDAVH